MINNSKDEFYHIGRAAQLLDEVYDLDVDIRKVREAATRVVNNAAPIRTEHFLLRACIHDFKVRLPCEAATIISVTGKRAVDHALANGQLRGHNILFREFGYTDKTITTPVGDPANPDGFQRLADLGPVMDEGKQTLIKLPPGIQLLSKPYAYFVPFSLDGNVLEFNNETGFVDIIYATLTTDETGFPLLTEKGIWAVVQWVVYLDQVKRFYKKEGNANAVAHAKEEYERAVAQARTPTHITDNQRDELMQALVSKYRHKYSNPFKG